jgi:CheY-like chemotaxis protein
MRIWPRCSTAMQGSEDYHRGSAAPVAGLDATSYDRCVLVVDDDAEVRRLVERLLAHAGIAAITAADPLEAAQTYSSNRPADSGASDRSRPAAAVRHGIGRPAGRHRSGLARIDNLQRVLDLSRFAAQHRSARLARAAEAFLAGGSGRCCAFGHRDRFRHGRKEFALILTESSGTHSEQRCRLSSLRYWLQRAAGRAQLRNSAMIAPWWASAAPMNVL